jgi:hypothetical protein
MTVNQSRGNAGPTGRRYDERMLRSSLVGLVLLAGCGLAGCGEEQQPTGFIAYPVP